MTTSSLALRDRQMRIHLIGPGGAGKSTVGPILAARLAAPFIDLDSCFRDACGDISNYLARHGYAHYAHRNVELYRALPTASPAVVALSSGFMTYDPDVHPQYKALRYAVVNAPTTFALLPTLDFETCVAEIVRRQTTRPFGLVPSREATKIRQRFHIYLGLPTVKVTTLQPPEAVALGIAEWLHSQAALSPRVVTT